nr:MAG TPA: hypothetical protein [Caudoviricetes sp.]
MANDLQTKLDAILNDKNTNLKPENLKKGVTCLGVIGALEAGSSTTSGVKLFETEEEMQADTTAKEGDLAVVYKKEIHNMTADSEVTSLTFPEIVTLPSAYTDNCYTRIRAVDSSIMFDGNCQLDQNSFRFDSWSESGMIRVEYTSTDGITYTRTRMQGNNGDLTNPVELPTTCKVERGWNDNLGYFMQTGGMNFNGMYLAGKKLVHTVNYDYTVVNNKLTSKSIEYDYDELIKDLRLDSPSGSSLILVSNYSNDKPTRYWSSGYGNQCIIWYNNMLYFGLCHNSEITDNMYTYYKDVGGSIVHPDISTAQKIVIGSKYYYIFTDSGISDNKEAKYFCYASHSESFPLYYIKDNTVTAGDVVANAGNYHLQWILAPTQLTLKDANELLPGKIAYGKNGVVKGDGSIYDNLSQEDVLTKVYGLIKTPDLDYYTGINKQTDLLLTRNIVDKYKYNMVRLKKLDNFDPNNAGMAIPLNNIKISKHNLYQFSDIISESDLADIANSGSIALSDDGKTLGLIVLYNGNSYIIDLETHSVVKTFITRNVKLYKHKVFYATNDLTNESSSDLNYYCYDLNTRENTIVATRPIGSVKNKYICRVNTYGRIITLLTYDRNNSTNNYSNAVNATFIDCESNQTSSMPEISWTTSGNSVGNVISCAANDGVYILVYKYTVSNPVSVIKCDLNLVTSTLLEDVTLSGTNPVVDNYYTVEGIQYNNTLMYQRTSGAYYINLTNKTGGYLSNMESINLSSNNIAMALKDDRYYPITGIDSTNSYSLILDKSKFIPAGYERTRIYGTEVYMCLQMYETILTLETNSIAVVSWGNIVTNKFNVTLLTTVQDDTYDYIAINIGGTNANSGPRFIPLGNANLSLPKV